MDNVRIEHLIDEIITDGGVDECYNFVKYHFEAKGLYCWARAYADDFSDVSVHGPFTDFTCRTKTEDELFFMHVVKYLKRRFPNVQKLDQNGYTKISN